MLLFSRCDEITGGNVETTAGDATGDVKTSGFDGRNLFGDKTCCGALATCAIKNDEVSALNFLLISPVLAELAFVWPLSTKS